MIGLGIARFCLAKLFGERNRKDAHRSGFDYANKLLKANKGSPAIRSTVDLLMQEAYLSSKEANASAKARAEGIYEALADYRQDFPRKG